MNAGLKTDIHQALSPLAEHIASTFSAAEAEAIEHFAQYFFQVASADDLSQKSTERLLGPLLSSWEFVQQYDRSAPKVRLFNPDLEQHGWHSSHTVIQLLFPDMPFLVDSVRMALNHEQIGIHSIFNSVLPSRRSGQQLEQLSAGGESESFIYLEVDRQTDTERLRQLRHTLSELHTQVAAAVHDYDAMRNRAAELATQLRTRDDADAREAADFIDWLQADNFTFIACDQLDFGTEDGRFVAQRQPGQELGTLRLESDAERTRRFNSLSDDEQRAMQDSAPLQLARYSRRSRIHRPAYLDLVVVKRFDVDGQVCGEHRFYGLYTLPVYRERLERIPLLRCKLSRLLANSGFSPNGHSGKALVQILHELPRDEVLLASDAELLQLSRGVFDLQERRRTRLLMRRDTCGKFATFLYFVPRDSFNTELRSQVQDLLARALNTTEIDFTTYYSESILARVHFVARIQPEALNELDFAAIEAEVVAISRSWSDDLHQALIDEYGEARGNRLSNQFRSACPPAYRQHFSPAKAVFDLGHLESLSNERTIAMSFYRQLEQSRDELRFKLFLRDTPLVLSDAIPVLENLGMRVLGEHPYRLDAADGSRFWIHDFTLSCPQANAIDLDEVRDIFQEAFAAIWSGLAENDAFNQLVISAGLNWREVAMLRAYARYNQQTRFGFSQSYMAATLVRHSHLTRLLVAFFRARFEPQRQTHERSSALTERIHHSLLDALEQIENLSDDQILRRYLELMQATLRTNYFQLDNAGMPREYLAFKLSPAEISNMPKPRPVFEVFVYSPRIEGVHLRGGKVARGGLRWSDRLEDYRTEVLGLVKAQQVKNAVIVPMGAKGGFVAKQLPTGGSREEMQAEGIACYRIFISALLDITDNLESGSLVPPVDVVRHDDDDPYLVVAADKGTATFSDIANAIAAERSFWLGDAFASGGSQGYDHKGMGITARGAWESVKLHFSEQGLDTQRDDFTVIGIGDMAGDVFGNGMLLSEHIRLVAAFNHMHIFLDPNPDAATSYTERQRLFNLPRSSWEDYDTALISNGGGVFSRSAKWIPLSPELRERLQIDAERLSPNDLIRALLKAPVDLIWNGGIGTYIKASHESHADAGDKASDPLRVDGCELRCKVLGEGGNLGATQLGRIEFCRHGGRANTDFIDNAGGVDCSDHEVNIKILLNEQVAAGDLTLKQRNSLLREMTDEVATLVLQNNRDQALAISNAEHHARQAPDAYIRLIRTLEQSGRLDRALEFLPDDAELEARKAQGELLTRPELSVLISYSKSRLKEALIDSTLIEDAHIRATLLTAFPPKLRTAYPEALYSHRLCREILATQLANALVNQMGITFIDELQQSTGAAAADIVRAWICARDSLGVPAIWLQIHALDNRISPELQQQLRTSTVQLLRRTTRGFLRQSSTGLNTAELVEEYGTGMNTLRDLLPQLRDQLPGLEDSARLEQLLQAGVDEQLSIQLTAIDLLDQLLGVVIVASSNRQNLELAARIYFDLTQRLELPGFAATLARFKAGTHWQTLAIEGLEDLLTSSPLNICRHLLTRSETVDADALADWQNRNTAALERWQQLCREARGHDDDIALLSVAAGELKELSTCM
ncbi:glutamate dehydrogenase (NAD) [Marinobacterium halophilum]|uniref:Glutamate dehydrogenase (NAD) n=1 Tax=Marinobacterium halophilum TaxID=267374 RepID=A0A2P8F3K4_9GAMM|nr:NAD-glutamate dehydrogenase [Marinobacterium halophilum]PSL16291.1 glutamate dehydrogenase (NAD) [Marinobacterium halophilum]